jgi:hypothetical protein
MATTPVPSFVNGIPTMFLNSDDEKFGTRSGIFEGIRVDTSLDYQEALLLVYTKNDIQQLLNNRTQLIYYPGCTQKQQDRFITWIKKTIPNANEGNQLSSPEFRISSIVNSLYSKTKSLLCSHMPIIARGSPNAVKNEYHRQAIAEELMKNLDSRGCPVLIFSLEQMKMLATITNSAYVQIKV